MNIDGKRDQVAANICYGELNSKYIQLKSLSAKKILDLGGSTGWFAQKLKEKDEKIITIDLNMKKLKECTIAEPVYGNILSLPFKNDTFDIVIARAILHHVPNDLNRSLIEIKRVLKDNGVLMIEEPCALNPVAYTVRKLLPSTFHDVDEKPFLPGFLKKRIEKRFMVKEIDYYCLFSYPMPYLVQKLPNITKPLGRRISHLLYNFDKVLLTSGLFQHFCGYLYILAKNQ